MCLFPGRLHSTPLASSNATTQPPRPEDGRLKGAASTTSDADAGAASRSSKLIFAKAAPKEAPPTSRTPAPGADVSLPRVLLIGDSICYGYEKHVRKQLEGRVELVKNPGNAEYTGNGIKHLDEWLGDVRWDVIHFNWGLWDMYGWRYHNVERSPASYEKRLETLVTRLKQTGAKLIWATTTPACPGPEKTMLDRFQQSVRITPEIQNEYAEAALRVMKRHSVAINDLHALMLPHLKEYLIAEDNVHYTDAGSQRQADQVTKAILEALR